jgi:hypothetical protein
MPIIQNKSQKEVCLITELRLKHRAPLSMSKALSSMSNFQIQKSEACKCTSVGCYMQDNSHLSLEPEE